MFQHFYVIIREFSFHKIVKYINIYIYIYILHFRHQNTETVLPKSRANESQIKTEKRLIQGMKVQRK